MNIFNVIVFGICILFIAILLVVYYLMRQAEDYYAKKLADMNNCYGFSCEQCEKYKKTCNGREIKNEEEKRD